MKERTKAFFENLGERVIEHKSTTVAALAPLTAAAVTVGGQSISQMSAAALIGLAVNAFSGVCLLLARS